MNVDSQDHMRVTCNNTHVPGLYAFSLMYQYDTGSNAIQVRNAILMFASSTYSYC